MILLTFSGATCLIVSVLMLHVLKAGFDEKPHLLKMFQFFFFASLFTLGLLQILSSIYVSRGVMVPDYYGLIYSSADLVLALLGVMYYIYYVKHRPIAFK